MSPAWFFTSHCMETDARWCILSAVDARCQIFPNGGEKSQSSNFVQLARSLSLIRSISMGAALLGRPLAFSSRHSVFKLVKVFDIRQGGYPNLRAKSPASGW